MASQCKRQQCTIDRRGFRQELDSWRHKLIHCVGFESILEGLFGPELVEDLKLFKDLEPVAASDWSSDENCQFCCLRRDKVKEHLIGLNKEGLPDPLRPHLAKDHASIRKLEKQAEEFLNAVLNRKDVPSFSDPHIPVVAREILQRMIRQFAAEYTSKTSPPQDSFSDNQPSSDQSLTNSQEAPSSPTAVVAGPAHSQNPVLSKLLMADQDAPLDLTIKKPHSEPSEQDGVLDLSIKKNRHSSSAPVPSPRLSPLTSTLKGESHDLRLAKTKELQSTPSLEHFIAKLCIHHQRQIVTALGYLQSEMKVLSNTQPCIQKATRPSVKPSTITPVKFFDSVKGPCTSTPKVELHDISVTLPSVKKKAQVFFKSDVNISAIETQRPSLRSKKSLAAVASVDPASNRQSDHVPLKMKIMKTSNVAAGNKLSCVLTTSISSDLEDGSDHTKSSHSARLSYHTKKQHQSSHLVKKAKVVPTNPSTVHPNISSDLPRTARKSIRAAMELNGKECAQRIIVDPDIGQCDIVYINKPITECFNEPRRHMTPRRNARKSTRGHLYSDDVWVVKTVRTLAGRGNCPNPMPDFITLVTPKQMMAKPESVPPVDGPFIGACVETVVDSGTTDKLFDRITAGSEDVVEVAVNEADIGIETSQTDQQLTPQDSYPQPLARDDNDTQDVDGSTIAISAENIAPVELEINGRTEGQEEESCTVSEPKEDVGHAVLEVGKTLLLDNIHADGTRLEAEQPPQKKTGEDVIEEVKRVTQEENQSQEHRAPITSEHHPVLEKNSTAASKPAQDGQAIDKVSSVLLAEDTMQDNAEFSKTPDKDLPPSIGKGGSVNPALEKVEEVIVGYVNGKPISASDRSLRHKLTTSPLSNKTEKSKSKKTPPPRATGLLSHQDSEGIPMEAEPEPAPPQTPPQIPVQPSSENSKTPTNSKQVKREKRKLNDSTSSPDSHESKRQLRSSSQKQTVELPSTSKLSTSSKKLLLTPTEVPNPVCRGELVGSVSPQKHEDAQVISTPVKPCKVSTKVEDSDAGPKSSSSPLPPSSPVMPSGGLASQPPSLPQTVLDSRPPLSPAAEKPDDDLIVPPSASFEKPDNQGSPTQPMAISAPTLEAPKLSLASTPKKSSLQSNTEDKPLADSKDALKVEGSQAKQRLRSARVSERSNGMGTKAASSQPPPSAPPKSGVDELLSVGATQKSLAKETQRDESERSQAKHKLRSAKGKDHLDTVEAFPQTSATSESTPSTSQKSLVQTNTEAQPGVVNTVDAQTDKSESSPAKQSLRSAKVGEDLENSKANADMMAARKPESPMSTRRSKSETEAKDLAQKPALSELLPANHPASANNSPEPQRPTRMPLRSERSKADLHRPDEKKPGLRSQKHSQDDTSDRSVDLASQSRTVPKKQSTLQPRSPSLPVQPVPQTSSQTVGRSRTESCKKVNKFFELLNHEENKQLLTNMNIRFDKMQKGWVQLDKETQPATKNKFKADRQAAIWKSKRRVRKPKLLEHQKYSPVQMLFMRGFDLSSICHWFLESTETKSLVIVKKVNTRLPSETQLCFHSSSSSSVGSLGVFPSLQAERLKKHLKKFAIASPVKSNPRSQKLIAKVLGLEASAIKGKEKKDVSSGAQTSTKSRMSAECPKKKSESQKTSKSKNPTSARILRKYSNIRGKMQVQNTNARLKDTSGGLKAKNVKVAASKSSSKSSPKPAVKSHKNPVSIGKQTKESPEHSETGKVRKTSIRVPEKTFKVKKADRSQTKKSESTKRSSQRIGSPKRSEQNAGESSRTRPEKEEAEKQELKKSPIKSNTKTLANPEPKKTRAAVESSERSSDASVTPTAVQVLTRSQKKEAAAPRTKTRNVTMKTQQKNPKESRNKSQKKGKPTMTRSGAPAKPSRGCPVPAGPSAAKKAKKRALEILATPAKRSRVSPLK